MPLPYHYKDAKVCIIGLGYVGLTLAVAMADVGFQVTGIEVSPEVLGYLRKGQAHFSELGLDARLARQLSQGRLTVRERLDSSVEATVYIVTVGTPVGPDHKTRMESIRRVAEDLTAILRPGDLVVLRSTVRVGVTRTIVKPILDRAGVPYHLAFCPERTLEGKALEELRTLPQIIGGVDEASSLRAAQLFHFLTPTIVRVTDAETAELIKLVNNTYRDLVFAFANEVAGFADALGVSALEVVRAGGLGYPRGTLPMPGPVGGPCLEKDPYILSESVQGLDAEPRLTLGGRTLNERLPERVARDVAVLARTHAGKPPTAVARVAVLGLAFKGRPETSDLRGTMARPLIAALRNRFPNAAVIGFDPVVPREDALGLGIEHAPTLEAAFEGADLVVIQNNHPLFGAMAVEDLSERMQPDGIIYDLWNQHEPGRLTLRADVLYAGLGTTMGRLAGDGARG